MKFDKLEKWYAGQCSPSCVVYGANEVDAAIAELKEKFHDVDNQWNEQCKEIAQLKSENERLKAKLESVQATAYADSVDAGMRERRLKRALWLARAFRARDILRWWLAATLFPTTEGAKVWKNIEIKCLKKAELYK